ncbi:MAG: SDR family NAD(P)-dependent oxidoreductase [Panacagrimonas sp.]
MSSGVCWVVTGADRGIGAAMCALLAARGDHSIAACFGMVTAPHAPGIEVVAGVDIATDAGVQTLVRALGARAVDVIVHNAGLVIERRFGEFDFDAFQREYAVNTLLP